MHNTSRLQDVNAAVADALDNPLALAESTQTTPEVLWQLAWHYDPVVREAVADNPNANTQTLWLLANDVHPDVRYALAENANTPDRIIKTLLHDQNPYVAQRAFKTQERKTCSRGYSLLLEKLASCACANHANALVR